MPTPVKRVQLPQSLQAVEDLLLWDNVFKSAAVLGLATLLYVLLEWSGLGSLLSGEDLVLSAKAFALLWVVGWVGRYITPVGMLFAAVLGLFTLPKLYEMRKDEIDDAVMKTHNAAQQHYMNAKVKTVQLINRLTPQKGPRPASSEISTPKSE
eukprot:gene9512-9676_t